MIEMVQAFRNGAFALLTSCCGGTGFPILAFAWGFSPSAVSFAGWRFQTRDLAFDHRSHFDAQVVVLEKSFERGNGARVATRAQRENAGHTDAKMRLVKKTGDLFRDVLVVFLQASQAGDGRIARLDGLAGRGPLEEKRDSFVVTEWPHGPQGGVAQESVGRIGGDRCIESDQSRSEEHTSELQSR